jgi:transposase-like protein
MPKPFTWPTVAPPLKLQPAPSVGVGGPPIPAWCGSWNAIYPELLAFFRLPRHLWKKLRTTNIIERCFVEVRRRTRPMVCFVNVQIVERMIYSIFQRFNREWKTRTLRVFTQAA